MCVWLPNFPLQRVLRGRPELKQTACVLYQTSGNRGTVVTCSREAAQRGVTSGMPLGEARALLHTARSIFEDPTIETAGSESQFETATGIQPTSHFERQHPEADLAVLRSLAWECQQFSPLVGIEPFGEADSLLIDITGGAHLFGGERQMALKVVQVLSCRGFFPHVAVAATIGAAWAIAHYGAFATGRPRTLRALPVESLRLPSAVTRKLHEFDLHSIGQLRLLPESSLPSRFGKVLTQRLAQAFGRLAEVLTPERRQTPVAAVWPFEEPVGEQRLVVAALRRLVEQVIDQLREQNHGVLQLGIRFTAPDAEPVSRAIRLVRPSVSLTHLWELVSLHLERLTFPQHVSRVHVQAALTAPLETTQQHLFENPTGCDDDRQLAVLVNRLSSRLGKSVVVRPQRNPEVQPELAVRYLPLVDDSPVESKQHSPPEGEQPLPHDLGQSCASSRPLCLFQPPIIIEVVSTIPEGPPARFWWKQRQHSIAQSWGPERLETGWWRTSAIARDYYRVETDQGRRFWLFRDINKGTWHLHGTFE